MPKRELGHLENLENWATPITERTYIKKAKKEQDQTWKPSEKEKKPEVCSNLIILELFSLLLVS